MERKQVSFHWYAPRRVWSVDQGWGEDHGIDCLMKSDVPLTAGPQYGTPGIV